MDEDLMHDCCCDTCIFNNSKDDESAYCTLLEEEMPIDNSCHDYDEGVSENLHHVW